MVAKEKVNQKQAQLYLVVTPLEQLYDDGLAFDGESEKDKGMNQMDFAAFRDIYLRCEQALSPDARLAIIRALRQMVKPDFLNQ